MRRHLLMLAVLFALTGGASAQYLPIYCGPNGTNPCTNPGMFTGTGDPAYIMAGKINAMFNQTFGMFGAGSAFQSTGVPIYSDILNLWSGSKNSTTCPSGAGTMVACGGANGTVNPGTTNQVAVYTSSGNVVSGSSTIAANTTGNAATATALAASPSTCSSAFAYGIAASGNADCFGTIGWNDSTQTMTMTTTSSGNGTLQASVSGGGSGTTNQSLEILGPSLSGAGGENSTTPGSVQITGGTSTYGRGGNIFITGGEGNCTTNCNPVADRQEGGYVVIEPGTCSQTTTLCNVGAVDIQTPNNTNATAGGQHGIAITVGSSVAASGGGINIDAGNGDGASNTGGPINIQAGTADDAQGGIVTLIPGSGTTPGCVQIDTTVTVNEIEWQSCDATIQIGSSGTSGGTIDLQAAAGIYTNGATGSAEGSGTINATGFYIDGTSLPSVISNSGITFSSAATIQTSAGGLTFTLPSLSSGTGNAISMTAGAESGSSAAGGVNISSGSNSGSSNGGNITLTTGSATGSSGRAGNINLDVGSGTTGGNITLSAGGASGSSDNGGAINLDGGAATGTGNGGNINLTPGTGTAAGFIVLNSVTTGTNADFLCLSSGGDVLLQSSACTISSLRYKKNVRDYRGRAEGEIARLRVARFEMKGRNPDPNGMSPQIGLIAEDVAKVMPDCAIYEHDMRTPKSYRQECVIAMLVKANQEQQREIDALKKLVGR